MAEGGLGLSREKPLNGMEGWDRGPYDDVCVPLGDLLVLVLFC